MGKSMNRDQRKNSKYISREVDRKLKEQQQYSTIEDEKPDRPKPKKKWRPHSEIDDE